jgi:hypothetical protein
MKSRYYFGDNPNPVRGTLKSLIYGIVLSVEGILLILSCVFALPLAPFIAVFLASTIAGMACAEDGVSWQEDLDGDGEWETIIEQNLPGGRKLRTVIEEDGTIRQTEYGKDGEVTHEWLMIPDPENPEDYTIYVWDEEEEDWLVDQDQNGIPDEQEGSDDSGDSGDDSGDSGDDDSGDSGGGNDGDNDESGLPEGAF